MPESPVKRTLRFFDLYGSGMQHQDVALMQKGAEGRAQQINQDTFIFRSRFGRNDDVPAVAHIIAGHGVHPQQKFARSGLVTSVFALRIGQMIRRIAVFNDHIR